ncbi:MAG: HPr family phosphocarrier protein [Planctomycetia bacterium]|nr:HPr family phosphocarrier protein [Planctomycetia bacterium]
MELTPLQRKVLVANPNGLHLRPSAAFAELAARFESNVSVRFNDRAVNGKSIWDLISLAAMPGVELILEADGPDASEALEALAELLAHVPSDGESGR